MLVVESILNCSKSPSKLVEGWGKSRTLPNFVSGGDKSFGGGSSRELVTKVALSVKISTLVLVSLTEIF